MYYPEPGGVHGRLRLAVNDCREARPGDGILDYYWRSLSTDRPRCGVNGLYANQRNCSTGSLEL